MGRALASAGFAAPVALLVGRSGRAGLLVTADTGGEDLLVALARLASPGDDTRVRKRDLLRRLGREVARLHAAGFVHGDLVPPNLRWRDGTFVFLDNDRTHRGWPGARRNLVQLGRFVVPGVTASDRARVLHAYASARGLDRRRRHRLGAWVMRKIMARRCAIDRIPAETAARAGFRALMRSGGPFDPALLAAERA
jgi:Ser/Thr protein kinase RdoA (MazF antagonist)